MKKIFIVFSLFTFFLFSSFGVTKDKNETLSHGDKARSYVLHLPKNYNTNQVYPLIIALHGTKGTAKGFNKSTNYTFNALADKENFIVVYPQGVDKSWNDNKKRNEYEKSRKQNIDDVGFISKLIDKLVATYNVDSNNVFACGISNGGLMSATLGTRLQHKIKAIGMVSSNFSLVHFKEMEAKKPQPFSMIIIAGTKDPIFPYNEGDIGLFKKKRGSVIGAEKSIEYICKLNGNSLNGIETKLPDTDKTDGCTSTQIVFPNAKNPNLRVELINVINGGHTWPGGTQYLNKRLIGLVTKDFNAVDELWIFFKKHISDEKQN